MPCSLLLVPQSALRLQPQRKKSKRQRAGYRQSLRCVVRETLEQDHRISNASVIRHSQLSVLLSGLFGEPSVQEPNHRDLAVLVTSPDKGQEGS